MSMEMGNFTLRVDPEKLQTEAGNLKSKIDMLKANFDEIISKVNSTANYWSGDAADTYRAEFSDEQSEFDEAFGRLNEHVVDLYNIAAVYTGAEQMAQGYAEALLSDVIE